MKNKNAKFMLGLFILAVLAVLVTLIIIQKSHESDSAIIRTGQIEMKEYDISSKIPGRIEQINADEGDNVIKGEMLFKISDRELKAKLEQAKGALNSAKGQLNLVLNGARKEQLEMAEKNYNAAKSQYELAMKTFNRIKSLYSDSLLSGQEFDGSEQKLKAATAQMEASKAQLELAVNGARSEEKQIAYGQFERANQSVEEVKSYLDETTILAPVSGIVGKKFVNLGEIVATGYPVLTIIDTADVWAELNLSSSELEKIKIGNIVKGFVHGAGIKTDFKVVSISAMADYANWRASNDKGSYEVRSFNVKLRPVQKNSSFRGGMTVSFEFNK